MSLLLIPEELRDKLLEIANAGLQGRIEVARVFSILEYLEEKLNHAPDFWNIRHSASGHLTSCANLPNGTPIWRLCSTHVHCIALLAMQEDDNLLVLAICSEAELTSRENDFT